MAGERRKGFLVRLMGCSLRTTLVAAFCIPGSFATISNVTEAHEPQRTWTVRDSVALRYVVLNQDSPEMRIRLRDANPIVTSPDGKLIFFVTYHGLTDRDAIQSDLRVFEIGGEGASTLYSSARHVQPYRQVSRLSYSSKSSGILDARWTDDSRGILFRSFNDGDEGSQFMQVFRLDVRSGRLHQLTSHGNDVESFAIQGEGVDVLGSGSHRQEASFLPRRAHPSRRRRRGLTVALGGAEWTESNIRQIWRVPRADDGWTLFGPSIFAKWKVGSRERENPRLALSDPASCSGPCASFDD
jgi:hypothetical protein